MIYLHRFIKSGWAAVLFIVLLVVLFSSPYLFLSKTPFPSSYQVNHFPPWSSMPEFWGPVKNGAMPDIVDQIYPWRSFSVSQLALSKVAYWNPNSFAGNPHLANFQSSVFSPFNILFAILPFVYGWTVLIVAQPLIAGLSMYVFLRSYKRSRIASVLGGTAFMFSGFIVVWMAYGTLAMAIAVSPLALFSAKSYLETGKIKFGILLASVLAFSFFSGHFQTSLYLLLLLVLYGVFLSYKNRNKKRIVFMFGFFALGLLISLLQILPTIQFYLLSVRSDSFITGGGIPLDHLVTIIAPDFFGNPVTGNDWVGSYAEWAAFVGVIPLFLAFLALQKREPVVKFFWAIALVVLLLAVSSPVQGVLGALKIPVLSTSSPSRIIVLLSFSLAFLSAFGLDNLRELIKAKSTRTIVYAFLSAAVLFAVVWLALFTKIFPDQNTTLALKNFILPSLLFGILILVVLLAVIFRKKKYILTGAMLLILFMTSLDSLRFVTKWMPVDPIDRVFVDLPVIEAMRREVGHGRMFGNLGAQVTTYYNIPGIEGYDPLYIGRYGEFIRASQNGTYQPAERSVVKLDRNGKYVDRVIDLLGVSIIFHPIADTNQEWAYSVWESQGRFEEIYADEKFQLLRNKTVIPRGTVYYDYEIIADGKETLTRFYEDEFDFRRVILLEKDPEIVSSDVTGSGSAKIVYEAPERIVFDVRSNKPGLLFLSDNFYPGWRAKVNGKDTEIYRANYTFRAVPVPEGKSEVEFYYQFSL